ncbi:MAG: pilus assembly protein PilM [Phycisphaeraceae bacterium]|nr:pilus assembly protein PilM [Phycisphaeraceae bacterium]
MQGFGHSAGVIGLDIGRVSVKAVQVTLSEKGPRLDGAVRLDRSGPGLALEIDEAQQLLRTMQRRGMTASRAVLVAPADALVGGSLNVPPADSGVSRDKIVEMELSRTHKMVPGSFEMAWWDLPMPASGSRIGQVHALGLPHAAVQPSLEVMAEAGLGVIRTVPGSLALLAAAQRHPIDPRCISAVVDLGSTCGHLSLMMAGRVVHERSLPDFNTSQLCEATCETLGVEHAVARYALSRFGIGDSAEGAVVSQTAALLTDAIKPLTEEISMSFAYVSHLYPEAELGHLLLAGGGANLSGLAEALAEVLELRTTAIKPAWLLPGDCLGDERDDSALSAALGAALCGEVL